MESVQTETTGEPYQTDKQYWRWEKAWERTGIFKPSRKINDGICKWSSESSRFARLEIRCVFPSSGLVRAERPRCSCVLPDIVSTAESQILCSDFHIWCPESQVVCPESQIVYSESQIVYSESQILCPETQILCPETQIVCPNQSSRYCVQSPKYCVQSLRYCVQ